MEAPFLPILQVMTETPGQEIDAQLEELEAKERDISLLRRKLHDRLAVFPEGERRPDLESRERELSKERRELHRRIDELRAQRDALRTQHEDAAP